MKSYSKVFKASNLAILDEVKIISKPYIPIKPLVNDTNSSSVQQINDTNSKLEDYQLIQEANEKAQAIIEEAEEIALSMEADANEKIKKWWDDNQTQLETVTLAAKESGYQEGFTLGKQEAYDQVRTEYRDKLEQINHLLDEAYEQKAAIIAEAEPFLLEISTAIASQIIKQELTEHPDKFIELIKQHILRFKEKEYITVCVHPDDYEFIQSQRAHLIAVVNGETEVKIIPDHSVTAKGCIIRTAYGSVDARIDTQMEEIKKVILAARGREHESDING